MEIPAGYAQANFVFAGASVPTGAEVTLGLNVGTYGGTATDAAGDVNGAWDTANINTLQVITCELVRVVVKFGPTATGPTGINTNVVSGTDASPGTPANFSYLVHKVTAFGGRAGRGRMYIPGVDETQVNDAGDIDSTLTDAMTTAMGVFRDELNTADLEPVLLHGEDSPITLPSPITAFVCDGVGGTQRRRMRR